MAGFTFDGKDFKDGSKKIGYIHTDSETIKDARGKTVGSIDGDYIKNSTGSKIAKFDSKVVKSATGSKIITIKEIQKMISGYGDSKLVAFYVLFLM